MSMACAAQASSKSAQAAPALDYQRPRRFVRRIFRRLLVALFLLAVAAAWPLCVRSYEHVYASVNWILGRTSTEVSCTSICNHTGVGMMIYVKRYTWDEGQTRYRATLMINDLTKRPRGTFKWRRPNRGWGITPVINLFPYYGSRQVRDFEFTRAGLRAGRWSYGPVRMEPMKLRGSATVSETYLVLPMWLIAVISTAAGMLLLWRVVHWCMSGVGGSSSGNSSVSISVSG